MEYNERITINSTKIVYVHEIAEQQVVDYLFDEKHKDWIYGDCRLNELPDGYFEKDGLCYKKATVLIHMEWAHIHTLHFENNAKMDAFISHLSSVRDNCVVWIELMCNNHGTAWSTNKKI